jgi:hypothetical protein
LRVIDVHSYFGGSIVPGIAAGANSISSGARDREIDAVVLLSNHARNVDPLAGNRILRKVLEQGPNLYGCLVTHINRVDSSVTVMRDLMGNKKYLAMAVADVSPDEPVSKLVADEIVNAYRRYGKPLFLFTPNAKCVISALEIAKGYPMLKVVFLGMGGGEWRNAIAAAHSCTNVYLETSGALDRAKLPAAVEAIGAHRILFGSGSPTIDAAAAMGLIHDSGLSEDAMRKIFGENAEKLFGLTAGKEAEGE